MIKLFSVASWLFPRLMVSCLLLDMTSYRGRMVKIKIKEFRGFPLTWVQEKGACRQSLERPKQKHFVQPSVLTWDSPKYPR